MIGWEQPRSPHYFTLLLVVQFVKDGKTFKILKFRSLRVNAEKDSVAPERRRE